MAVRSGFFNSVSGDRRYDARFFAEYFATFIGNGVFPNPSTGLQVTANGNLNSSVNIGKGWINGYYLVNDSSMNLQHDVADGTLSRVDRVVMGLSLNTRDISIYIKRGTNSANPVAPTLTRNANVYELGLAEVLINRGATVIQQSNITDTRLSSSVCGLVVGLVNQIDGDTLFDQFQSWVTLEQNRFTSDLTVFINQQQADFNDFRETQEAAYLDFQATSRQSFDDFFAGIQDTLSGDVAANLANQISVLDNRVTQHISNDALHVKYGTSSSASATATKVVNVESFARTSGSKVLVRFGFANTANNVALNVGGTGATSVYSKGQPVGSGSWVAGQLVLFVFTGTYWEMVAQDVNSERVNFIDRTNYSVGSQPNMFPVGYSIYGETRTTQQQEWANSLGINLVTGTRFLVETLIATTSFAQFSVTKQTVSVFQNNVAGNQSGVFIGVYERVGKVILGEDGVTQITVWGSWYQNTTSNTTGSLSNLTTDNKTNLVSAINEVKLNGNNVKRDVVAALLSVDDQLPINSDSPFSAIISAISDISTGKKFANGIGVPNGLGDLSVSGLDFTPQLILISSTTNVDTTPRMTIYVNSGLAVGFPQSAVLYAPNSSVVFETVYTSDQAGTNRNYVQAGSFRMSAVVGTNVSSSWIAIGE